MPEVAAADVERMAASLYIEPGLRSRSFTKFWTLLILAALIAAAAGTSLGVCRTAALGPARGGATIGHSAVGRRLASAARQGTGAARLGAPAIFRPATNPRTL